jgi:hypothetical protein
MPEALVRDLGPDLIAYKAGADFQVPGIDSPDMGIAVGENFCIVYGQIEFTAASGAITIDLPDELAPMVEAVSIALCGEELATIRVYDDADKGAGIDLALYGSHGPGFEAGMIVSLGQTMYVRK